MPEANYNPITTWPEGNVSSKTTDKFYNYPN